jgi:excisionase family DNA binding protein
MPVSSNRSQLHIAPSGSRLLASDEEPYHLRSASLIDDDLHGAEESAFERLLGVLEAARLLCVHPKTLQAMARAGAVPCVRMGKYWRFRASSLDVWVRNRLESDHQSRRVQ